VVAFVFVFPLTFLALVFKRAVWVSVAFKKMIRGQPKFAFTSALQEFRFQHLSPIGPGTLFIEKFTHQRLLPFALFAPGLLQLKCCHILTPNSV